jgi:CRP/FNR family transcriptional regulator, polysaccharide utilization system transcription regulator
MKKEKSVPNSCTLSYEVANCFNKLSHDEMLLLENNRVEVSYKKGETICKQGTYASHIMYICSGLVKIYMENEKSSLTLKILPAGNMIGLTALQDGNNIFQYSAYAYQNSKIRLIDIKIFKQLIVQNPLFANEVINLLCENSIQTYTRFFAFTQKQSYGRLADTLLCLACNIFKNEVFDLNLTRKELGELTGMTPESVIRILSKFNQDKIIEMDGKTIRIVDKYKLQQISNLG